MQNSRTAKYVSIIFITYPLLDMIYSVNHVLLHNNLPINEILRTLILGFLMVKIQGKKARIYIGLLMFLLICDEVSYFVIGPKSDHLVADVGYLLKVLFFAVTVLSIWNMLKRRLLRVNTLINAMIISGLIISLSIILSVFGAGLHSWTGSLRSGYDGLFTVPNTVTATLLVISPLSLYMFVYTKKIIYVLSYILFLGSLGLIGTKAGIAGAFGIFILQGIMLAPKIKHIIRQSTKRWSRTAVFSIIFAVILAFAGIAYLAKGYFIKFIHEQSRMYVLFHYKNLYTFLVSNRTLQLVYITRYIHSHFNYNPALLFGMGYSTVNQVIHSGKADFQAVEMDFHGLFYYSGIWIMLLILGLIVTGMVSGGYNVFRSKFDFKSSTLLLCILIGTVHATFAGHVLYEAMTLLYFGSILGIACHEAKLQESEI